MGIAEKCREDEGEDKREINIEMAEMTRMMSF